jgi:hypothetical protein
VSECHATTLVWGMLDRRRPESVGVTHAAWGVRRRRPSGNVAYAATPRLHARSKDWALVLGYIPTTGSETGPK